MSPLRIVVAVVIAACVADCAGERTQIANYAQNKMAGLTKEQVLACMGSPASKAAEGATEVWSYPSGNCTVNLTMMDGKVKRMNYVAPTGSLLSQNEQCFFTVANCTY
jgi:outer membrane protein assembly factor BamE (lipoprotein component of BamABCDE complex)